MIVVDYLYAKITEHELNVVILPLNGNETWEPVDLHPYSLKKLGKR